MISEASASGSAIINGKAYLNKVAAVQLASGVTGIIDELEKESLKQILSGVMKLKEGKIIAKNSIKLTADIKQRIQNCYIIF